MQMKCNQIYVMTLIMLSRISTYATGSVRKFVSNEASLTFPNHIATRNLSNQLKFYCTFSSPLVTGLMPDSHPVRVIVRARYITTGKGKSSRRSPSFHPSSRGLYTKFHSSISKSIDSPIPFDDSWERISNHQTSKTVKFFKSIHNANKSKRHELGFTVAEGVRLVTDILSNDQSRSLVRTLIVSESLLSKVDSKVGRVYIDELQSWLRIVHQESLNLKRENTSNDHTENSCCKIMIGTEKVLSACSGTVTNQGVVALIQIPRPNLSSTRVFPRTSPFYLILDGVSDPGNVGTLLRSCAASYVTAMILLPDSCDVWNPKVVRSSMGASFRVPVWEMNDLKTIADINDDGISDVGLAPLLKYLNKCGIDDNRVFAATMKESGVSKSGIYSKESIPHYRVHWVDDSNGSHHTTIGGAALILGSEGEGLRKEVREAVEEGIISTVHVPMAPGSESLNVAVCGSVIMFERMRQLSML